MKMLKPEAEILGKPANHTRATRAATLLLFFLITYVITWICFISVAVAIPASTSTGYLLVLLGAFAPSFVAVWLTARTEGATAVRLLLRRVVKWRVDWRWYVFAATYTLAIKLTVALIHRAVTGVWPHFGTTPMYIIPLAIVFSTPFQAGEEIGWRGYALPRLAARFGLARASVLLGLIWAFWHLPQFFIREGDTYGQSFSVFVLQVVALSVALAWLYATTKGSLLLTMLLHSAVNNSKDIVPSASQGPTHVFGFIASPVAWLSGGLLWLCAAYFLTHMPKLESSPDQ